jgi:hypothetical protein
MNALSPITTDTSELATTIDRARTALDAGDVQAALLLSSGAYEQAKAAGDYAKKVKASHELIGKARQMQADALKIETMCTIAMADFVDEAQAEGKLSRGGRPQTVQGQDRFSLADLGIDKRLLLEARKLRNIERAKPGFIERVVAARLAEGLEPSRASLRNAAGYAIGTKSASKADKGVQLYETPIEAMRLLLALESFSATVKEPFVGKGAILKPLEEAGYDVLIADLEDRGITTQYSDKQQVGDFLLSDPQDTVGMDIVSNPPYDDLANACIAHALKVHKPRKMAMLLNWNFAAGFDDPNRRFVMEECPPSRVYVFTKRLPMMHRDGWEGPKASSQMNTAWFVWEQNEDGTYGAPGLGFTTLRVFWPDFEFAEPARPGDGGHWTGPMAFREREEDFTRQTPKLTDAEKLDAVRGQALVWMANCGWFNMDMLRRGVGIRPTTASALVAELVEQGALCNSGGGWRWTGKPCQGGGV